MRGIPGRKWMEERLCALCLLSLGMAMAFGGRAAAQTTQAAAKQTAVQTTQAAGKQAAVQGTQTTQAAARPAAQQEKAGTAAANTAPVLSGKAEGTGILLEWQSDNENSVFLIERADAEAGPFQVVATTSGQKGTVSVYDYKVKQGAAYYYRVAGKQEKPVYSPVIRVDMRLRAPAGLSVSMGDDDTPKLTWEKVEDAAGYRVYRSKKEKKGYTLMATVKKASFRDKSVKHGKLYYYRVAAVHKTCKDADSLESEAVSCMIPPAAPKLAGCYEKKKVKLTWKNVSGAQKYVIYRRTESGKRKKIGQTSKTSFTDKTAKQGLLYIYQAAAISESGALTIKGKDSDECRVFADYVDPNGKMVAMTFDDGPGIYTQEIVDCLKKNHARATFFVLGSRVSSYKKPLQSAYKAGCEIGSHTYNHNDLTRLGEKQIQREMSDTDKKIKDVIGITPEIMRTPYGSVNGTVKQAVGKPIILWSIDTLDWKTRSKEKTVSAVMNHVKDGDIILMHDIHQPTKEAAIALIPKLQKKGYQLVTVSELARYRKHKLQKGSVYYSLRKK